MFYFNAYIELDSERHHGMGLMRIPWSSIMRYGSLYELDEYELDLFLFHIRELDSENLKWLRAQQKD